MTGDADAIVAQRRDADSLRAARRAPVGVEGGARRTACQAAVGGARGEGGGGGWAVGGLWVVFIYAGSVNAPCSSASREAIVPRALCLAPCLPCTLGGAHPDNEHDIPSLWAQMPLRHYWSSLR